MRFPELQHGWLATAGLLCAALAASAAPAAPAAPAMDAGRMLQHAASIKTSDHRGFTELLVQLDRERAALSPAQQWQLRYLEAWQTAYRGEYDKAAPLLEQVVEKSGQPELAALAEATLVNILGVGRHYEEAFSRLNGLLDRLPYLTRPDARFQILANASQFYADAGQYTLAASYADQLVRENPSGPGACKGRYLALHAQFRGEASPPLAPFEQAAALCIGVGETLYANGIRADIASLYLRQGKWQDAEKLLSAHYREVERDGFGGQVSQFDSLLAQAHWRQGHEKQARDFALAAVATHAEGEYSEPQAHAYRLLYEIERARGHLAAALEYHEKYTAADKAYLDDVSARSLAYQIVKQEVQARKAEIDALARKNQILQLQRALDRKEVEASRLYIAVLLLGLLAFGLWLLRLKRSQLQFMHMAQSDSLTGIYNRKHFISEAEHALRDAERSGRGACLVLIDLDHFKLINDTYGHATGDQVLRCAVEACHELMRSAEVFGRLGGEEFGILLPDCGMDRGIERAEAVRRAIARLSEQDDPGVPVSASFGVAFTGESGYGLRQLLMDADRALYRAKRAGRNCVVAGRQGEGVVVA